ncbi:hypothetical protein MMC30_008008 [Trapelia coarctata]|nr:hypothetical protein [Trapelia coarctata]
MGKIQSGPRIRETQDEEEDTEDQSPTSFLAGPVRARGSRFELLIGTAAGVQFGGCTIISGTGPEERPFVDRERLLDYLSNHEWSDELLVVHTACYDGVFSKVVDHVERTEHPRSKGISGSLNLDNMHACLKKVRLNTADFGCMFRQEPWVRAHKKSEAELAEERLLWARKRRDHLCDPGSSDWTNNYQIQWPQPSESKALGEDSISGSRCGRVTAATTNVTSNPFELLPVDVILGIADMLSIREVFFLSAASPAAAHKLNNSEFWKRRILKDMPWLWDFNLINVADERTWRRLYFDLWDKCIYASQRRTLGLVNRKRIWNLCLPIAESYVCNENQDSREWKPWRRTIRGSAAAD